MMNFRILKHQNHTQIQNPTIIQIELHYLMSKYFDIQYHEGENLTFTNEIKHVIKTKHEEPIYRRPYS